MNTDIVIYKIENLTNGKLYIGKTMDMYSRWLTHLKHVKRGTNRRLYDAMRKYGIENFAIEMIEECHLDSADDREQFWIAHLDTTDTEKGYNMTKGGGGGDTFTLHPNREAIRAKYTARRWTDEQRRKFAETMTGRKRVPLSDEHKRKISQTNKERGIKPPLTSFSGEEHPMYGRTHSPEARARISTARKNKSYEEIMGFAKAQEVKAKKRIQNQGENNPFYRHINMVVVLERLVESPRLQLEIIATEHGVCKVTLSRRLRKIMCYDNLQQFRAGRSNEELSAIFKEKLDELRILSNQ